MTRRIAIVGGGFCGTMVAFHLLQSAPPHTSVTLYNDKYPFSRGVAYSTSDLRHLLNVPARNMSAVPEDPDDFVNWLGTRGEYRELPLDRLRESFAPRALYGDYLKTLLWMALRLRSPSLRFELVPREVVYLQPTLAGMEVTTSHGSAVAFDHVVLATGSAAHPGPPMNNSAGAGWIADPWAPRALEAVPDEGHIVLLGTGLTMVDVVASLLASGKRLQITAVSRSGQLPRAHFRGIPLPSLATAHLVQLDLRKLVRWFRQEALRLARSGHEPAMLVDKLRPLTQAIWKYWSLDDRYTFLTGYRGTWNRLRHRAPTESMATINAALQSGQLRLIAGQIQQVTSDDGRLSVQYLLPDGAPSQTPADVVVNCLGPAEQFASHPTELFRSLLDRRIVSLDHLGLGIRVDDEFAVLDHRGRPWASLSALGPLIRGTLWETTAVPELRVQAAAIARRLALQPIYDVEAVEYCI